MDITLSAEDMQTMRGLSQDSLPQLRFEVARTDSREIRHLLVKRQELCERLLDAIGAAPAHD